MPRQSPTASRFALPVAVALVLALTATSGDAQLSPNGEEFEVNSYTTSNQDRPAIAADPQGNFVVAWDSDGSSDTDTSYRSIQGQRFDANGAPLGGQFQINTFTPFNQVAPAVASDSQGDFVVVWESNGSNGTDTSDYSIQGRRYDSNGVSLGTFQVNTYTTSEQRAPAVAADAQGNFVVVWPSFGSNGSDTSGWSIQAQRYDADGAALGGQFQVNSYTTNDQRYLAVATAPQGNFVSVWESFGSGGSDTSGWSIQAQRYDATGVPVGGEFQVNTYTTSYQRRPAVAVDSQGDFVVVWESNGSSGKGIPGSPSILGQRYDATGAALGGEFEVNSYLTNNQYRPAIAADSQGNIVVVWGSLGSAATDTSSWSVQGQRYVATGAALGGQFQVNSYTTSLQWLPAVTADPQGNFVVAWDSNGSSGNDPSGSSIQAQRYDGLYRDGFETGDLTRWSSSVP